MIYQPAYELIWNGINLTKDIAPYLTHLAFTDYDESSSDELEFTLDDAKGLWRNDYYPRKGDEVSLNVGWVDGFMDYLGTFQIDQATVSMSGQGNFLIIKALAALITQPLRSKKSARYENTTLRTLVNTIASNLEMNAVIQGNVPDVRIAGIAQHKETDLGFLRRVAETYGCIFTVKGKRIIFADREGLIGQSTNTRIHVSQLESLEITDATDLNVKTARHTYWDPEKKKKVSYEYQGSAAYVTKDIDEIDGHAENSQQSELMAKAAWLKANNGSVTGTINLNVGVSGVQAGNNIIIEGAGKLSGIYHISGSRHSITKSEGSRLSADVFRVGEISPEFY